MTSARPAGDMSGALALVRKVVELRAQVKAWRGAGARIGLVPTMGALHDGHLSLVEIARRHAERVVVSVFVNPRQFAPTEDFARYPRQEAEDAAKLAEARADLMFAPTGSEMYPPGFCTEVQVGGPARGLCADTRPHFFTGVATVVTKLLLQCLPDVAVFGEKDYQQLLVIRRMARDLDIPVEILGAPIVREADGLAMSSRNAYLAAAERQTAARLNQVLAEAAAAAAAVRAPEDLAGIAAQAADALRTAGFRKVDYVEIRDAETLDPVSALGRPARILAAAWLGETRLIDNMAIPAR